MILRGPEIDKNINEAISRRMINEVISRRFREAKQEPTVCFDFDGVLAYHESNWPLTKIGHLLPKGKKELLHEKSQGNKIVVLTARPEQYHSLIMQWCKKNGLPVAEVTNKKPVALRYYDDRAVKVPKNWGETKSIESRVENWKKSILGHHQDIMVDPRVREAVEFGVAGMKWGKHKSEEDLANAIKQGGGRYRGMMGGQQYLEDLATFDDPKTGSTLALPISQADTDSVKARIADSRKQFHIKESGVKGMKWGVRRKKWTTSRGDKIDYSKGMTIDYYRDERGSEVIGKVPITKDDLTNVRIFNPSKPGCSLFMDMVLNNGLWSPDLPEEDYASHVNEAKRIIASLPKSCESLVEQAKFGELAALAAGQNAPGGLDIDEAAAAKLLAKKYGNKSAIRALDKGATTMAGHVIKRDKPKQSQLEKDAHYVDIGDERVQKEFKDYARKKRLKLNPEESEPWESKIMEKIADRIQNEARQKLK